jgi:hypothetical protein
MVGCSSGLQDQAINLFLASSVKPYEWFEEWVPAWTQVGKYMRWAPKMEELANGFIKRAFGLAPEDPLPSVCHVFSPSGRLAADR